MLLSSNAAVRAAFGSILALSLAAPAGASDITPQEKALIPLAKQEGSVISLTSLFQDKTARALEAAFRKRYGLGDDFKYTNIRKGTGATVATARQEIKAGRFSFDVIVVPGGGFFHMSLMSNPDSLRPTTVVVYDTLLVMSLAMVLPLYFGSRMSLYEVMLTFSMPGQEAFHTGWKV